MTGLYALTIFVGAAQLFWVQPMLAKMLLPPLGGTPAVWNTCMVFFQALLLAGYAYAHFSTKWLGVRRQTFAHILLLLACAAFLPVSLSTRWSEALSTDSSPVLRLLGCLLVVAGPTFFMVSSTSPLLQRWYSTTRQRSAADPYFLYAASNLGSLAALLGYPLLIEPRLRLDQQSQWWTMGYGLLGVLVIACAVTAWRKPSLEAAPFSDGVPVTCRGEAPVSWRRWGGWLLLAFVPSSLMLGVTQYLVTDIASIPLLWVVPLSLYLGSFVVAFSPRGFRPKALFKLVLVALVLGVTFAILTRATHPVWLLLLLHLAFLFCAALACHAQLANDRPGADRLTEYYLWVALGGVLGGTFNALLAPLVFRSLIEYPIAIVLVGLVRPGGADDECRLRWRDLAWPVGIGLLTAALAVKGGRLPVESVAVRQGLLFGLPLILVFTQVARRWRFALALTAVFVGGSLYVTEHGRTLQTARSFFGVSRVTLDPGGTFRRLVHGNTWHGGQFTDVTRACEPLAYYHRGGPLGEIFPVHRSRHPGAPVGVIGLGTGSMVAYAQPGETWTFYEIDPAVIRLARDTNYFTYLSRCAAAPWRIVPGDARARLREAADGSYALLVLDAFSSDAIPVHLLTREALALYLAKLAPGGLLACHVSNRYLLLEEVLNALARDAGLVAVNRVDWDVSPDEARDGKAPSQWIVLARRRDHLGRLGNDARWLPLEAPSHPVWTDDFSHLLGILRWE